jgi:hypothetical protein
MSTPQTPLDKLLAACQDNYAANQKNCSGFLRAVARTLGKQLFGVTADEQTDFVRGHWMPVTVAEAVKWAGRGSLVVACQKGPEHVPPQHHGHVAIVVPGPLYHGTYPMCWCGSLGSGTHYSNGNQSVGQVWGTASRDLVTYHRAP